MTNECVHPKLLCFLQDDVVNFVTAIKYYLSDRNYDEIRKIEENFPSNIQPNNTESGNCIIDNMDNKKLIKH